MITAGCRLRLLIKLPIERLTVGLKTVNIFVLVHVSFFLC